ncbi:MAG: dihydroorotate dehydrogenase-like protein [Pelovirga sp.]
MLTDLSTNYMGLALENPLVVASCCLTGTLDGVRQCAEAGAGAVVLRSLFEEQIRGEISSLSRHAEDYPGYGEAFQYLQSYGTAFGPQQYLQLVRQAKQAVTIPIIASLNCVSADSWAGYAQQLQQAGADAIELNVSILATDSSRPCEHIVADYLGILRAVKHQANIPVALKIGPYFTSLAHVAKLLTSDQAEAPAYSVGWLGKDRQTGKVTSQGADALVLFNRFYRFDIDIDKHQLTHGSPYSSPHDMADTLRWISLLYGTVDCDFGATTGIHDSTGVIKALLAGATVTQLCSTLYLHGLSSIRVIEKELRQWMENNGYRSLADVRGCMSRHASNAPKDYERLQYVKMFIEQHGRTPNLRNE